MRHVSLVILLILSLFFTQPIWAEDLYENLNFRAWILEIRETIGVIFEELNFFDNDVRGKSGGGGINELPPDDTDTDFSPSIEPHGGR